MILAHIEKTNQPYLRYTRAAHSILIAIRYRSPYTIESGILSSPSTNQYIVDSSSVSISQSATKLHGRVGGIALIALNAIFHQD
jgi:hypothetical protein